MRTTFRPLLGIAAFLLTFSMTGFAQENFLEQTIVTATRADINAASLPLSWSVVDADALALAGQVHINELMQQVSGAWISRGNGQESLTSLRSPVLTGSGSCGAFFMAGDGISLRAPGFCNVNQLFDANSEQASRVEVIKGPATALYGSNAMHGVINILSRAPTQLEDHSVAVEAGPDDFYRAKYRYSNIFDRHGISVNLNGTTDGGYKDDSGYGQQKVTLRHDYTGERVDTKTIFDYSNLNQETSGFVQGEDAFEDNSLKRSNPNPEAFRDAKSLRLQSSFSWDLNERHRLTITPYLRDNEMQFLQHFLPWQPLEENGHQSVGLRSSLHTIGDTYTWVNGIDLEYTDGWLKETQAGEFSPNQPPGVHYDYQVDATSSALYSQLQKSLGDRFDLNVGARLEHTRYDYDNRSQDGSACAPEASACRFFRPADRDDDFSDWSLNAGVGYAFAAEHYGYFRFAKGFRAPQTTELYRLQSGQQVADLDSEEIASAELGVRGQTSGGLQYDISAYSMKKDEVIFQDSNRQNVSGAKTSHSGIDVSIDYAIASSWQFSVDATYAQHKYDSRIALIGSSGDIKGNDIDTAPNLFGSARIIWDFSALSKKESRAELEWVYLDSYYLEPDNEHEYEGHSLLNLRISTKLSERLSGALRVTNLTDENYAERADFGFGNYRYFVGQPMGAYFELSYQLGGS
ncbi:MAG: outer membrane receptor protein involved in Fe transport [Halioglobus sp.]|jgi:outer membrane receptor protein involved in Fe transport